MSTRPASIALFALAVLSALLILGPPDEASAQGFRRGERRGPIASCREDYARLCTGVRPGGGRIIACLNANAEKLSQPCFLSLAERGLAFAAVLRLCLPDFERLCTGVPPGMGRVIGCLTDNSDRISTGCRDALSAQGFGDELDEPSPPAGQPPSREQLPWQKR